MGIYVELHSTSGETIDRQELEKRLIEAGAEPFPEDPAYDTSGKFNIPGLKGFLRFEREKSIKSGIWASVRLSWATEADTWKRLLDIAERINGRIYDSTLDQYITYEMIDDIVEHYSSGVDMLGKSGKKE